MYRLALAKFPFTEKKKSKKRPVLVLTTKTLGIFDVVIIAYITSKKGEGVDSEVLIRKTPNNKLKHDSITKLHKLTNVLSSEVTDDFGEISLVEEKEIKTKLRKMLGL